MAEALRVVPEEMNLPVGDGVRIFVRSWRPPFKERAVVVICHGVNSHSGQYRWVAEQMVRNGLAAYALDLRGRGKSSGRRFSVSDVDEYVSDLDAVVRFARSRHPGVPVFVLGHSAGGVVSCMYALEHQQEIAGLICESFAFEIPAPDIALAIIKGLSHVAPHLPVLKLKNADFSRDPKAVERLEADPLTQHEIQPADTVAALIRADEELKKSFPDIRLPVFILHGTDDHATKPSGSKFFYDTAGSRDKTLKLYDGFYHDLLNDVGKETVMADISGWINKHLPKS